MLFVKYYKLVEVWIEFPLWGRLAVFGGAQFLPFVSHRTYGLPVNSSLETSISTIHAALAWIGHAPAPPWPDAANMTRFDDSDDFLLSHRAFDFPFYVVCLEQQGVPGLDLIRLIRRRNNAGILAISNQEGEGFVSALEAGADMVLRRDAPEDHLQAAILAIQRRSGLRLRHPGGCWRSSRSCRPLMARGYPWGTAIWPSCAALPTLKAAGWRAVH